MRKLKRILVILLALLILFSGGLLLLSTVYEKEVKEFLVGRINKQLKTKVVVESDDIHFSLFSDFPMASLNFDNITMLESPLLKPGSKATKPSYYRTDTLFRAGRVGLQFSIWDMITGDYRVRTVSARDGALRLRRGFGDSVNWDVWAGGGDSTAADTGSSVFRVEDIRMVNMSLFYRDLRNHDEYSLLVRLGQAAGEFTSDQYDLSIRSDVSAHYLRVDSVSYLEEKNILLDLGLKVDASQYLYTFTDAEARIADLAFQVEGWYSDAGIPAVDIRLKGKEMDIVSVLSLLPSRYQHYADDYDSDGEMYADLSVKGKWEGEKYPAVSARFGIRETDILQISSGITLKKTNLEGDFYYGPDKNYLDLKAISAGIRNGSIQGDLRLDRLSAPMARARLKADLPLEDLRQLLKTDTLWGYPLQSLQGSMKLNMDFSGRIPSDGKYRSADFKAMNLAGDLQLQDAGWAIRNSSLQFDSINGAFVFNDHDVEILSLSGRTARSDFLLKGYFRNILAYTLTDAADLGIDARLESGSLELDEFLVNQEQTTRRDTVYRIHFSPHLDFTLESEIGELRFRRFVANRVRGTFRLRDGKLIADPIEFNVVDGSLTASGMLDATRDSIILISLDANLNKLNINKLFYQFEDFGQDVISHKNLAGIGTATVQLAMVMKPDLSIDPGRIYVRSNTLVERGQLVNYEPMKALSDYISVAELEDIRFSTLHNQIEIIDQTIHIPKMEIRSSALDLTLNGKHTFNNEIDYHIKVLMSDVLFSKARKARKENEEFGVVEDDQEGRTSLFISMSGTVDNPVFRYDRKEAARQLKENIASEKQTLRQILKDEFGWFRKDTAKAVKPNPKDDKFILQWEDDEKKKPVEEDEDF